MAWLADLAPCTYVHDDATQLKSIGWLEPEYEYTRGPVDAAVVAKIEELRKQPWEPGHFMGYHACGYCNPSKREAATRRDDTGVYNLFIPADGFLFVAPELIVHYIAKHGYAPPVGFQQAVLACPAMNSPEYKAALKANGPQDWRPKWMRDRNIQIPGFTL